MSATFSQSGALWEAPLGHIDCGGQGTVTKNHTCWTSSMYNVHSVAQERRLYSRSKNSSGDSKLLTLDQKSVVWMMDLLFKFCREEKLALATCAGTLGTLIAG